MNCFLGGQQLLQQQQQRKPLRMFSTASSPPPDDPDENLLPNCAEPLGRPLPLDEHACSVSLPTWSSVVGYEEGDPRVTSKLTCGYPRFVYHPYILQLMDYVVDTHGSDHQDCLILPSPAAAARCQAFLQQALYGKETTTTTTNTAGDTTSLNDNDERITRIDLPCDIQAVLFPAETLAGTEAKAYWQHTGEIVSSRRAQVALEELKVEIQHVTPPFEGGAIVQYHADNRCPTVYDKLKERIANLTKVPPSHVHLSPSGMASIYMALRSSQRLKTAGTEGRNDGGGTSIVFGFPYLDTLKLCSRSEFCPGGVEFFGQGDEGDLNKLQTMLEAKKHHKEYCALFTEVPSNPLLRTPNVRRLRELATDHDFALIVDDTIGNFQNVNLLDHKETAADAICTSLTKLFSGRGDVMAGSLVVNPNTETGAQLQATLEQQYKEDNGGLFVADAWAMYHNSQDFVERNAVINDTAERLSDWLKDHSDVKTVYYPKYTKLYQQVHTGRGYGGLLAILLDQHVCQRTFFDALNVSKGPSLGTNFTLMCPYTLLAHYHELDFAMAYNVQPNLLRIAVGLEPFELLKGRFEEALTKSRLHPPLPKLGAQQLQRRGYSTSAAFSTSTTTRKFARFGVEMSKRLVR